MNFQIDKDGTIIRNGGIQQGNTSNSSGNNNRDGSGGKGFLIFLLLVASGLAIGFGVKMNEYESRNDYLNDRVYRLEERCDDLRNEYDVLNATLSMYSSRYSPIIITDVEIANVYSGGDIETSYGNTLYSYRTMYLKPRITYYGSASENIELKVKVFNSYGTLYTGSSSPSGYSYKTEFNSSKGENTVALSGWGGSEKGHWSSGNYRFEFWYGDVCLYTKRFSIY